MIIQKSFKPQQLPCKSDMSMAALILLNRIHTKSKTSRNLGVLEIDHFGKQLKIISNLEKQRWHSKLYLKNYKENTDKGGRTDPW